MLVLHSSSRCDVCMDAYTWQTIAKTPHAIACGHIFCRPCLLSLSPHQCPLCRNKFDPSRGIKKLHVDRPDSVGENRENDLLQRMAISAEAPEDQLQELLDEVDVWLDSQADDTCLVLRQARATLTKYLELKKLGATLEGALADIHTRFQDMTRAYYAEHRERTKLEASNSATIREIEDLKAEVKELRTVSGQHVQRRNPLPPPSQPVPTEYVPSFTQVMAHDRVPFKVQGHKYHKGKTKSLGHRSISPSQNPHPLPTQQAKMDPSEEGPALISHLDRHTGSPPSRQRPPTRTPPLGLELHFENTNQPLDAYELTHSRLREHSQDGQLMAEKQSSTTHQPRASTSHIHSGVSLHDRNESIDARSIRSTRSNRGTQPVSVPPMVDTPSRPLHQRHNTVSSIVASVESSSTGPGSRTQSSSRSISRSNPSLAEILSDNPSYRSRDSTGSRQRLMEPHRMRRGRNQPLPALSPSSFSYGEAITEEDNGLDSDFTTFGNALGLELLSTVPMPISAPTPVVPHRTFLRTFSDT